MKLGCADASISKRVLLGWLRHGTCSPGCAQPPLRCTDRSANYSLFSSYTTSQPERTSLINGDQTLLVMYSPRGSYGSAPPPELSNNPFIEHPSNALSRYPDINGEDSPAGSNQFTSWLQPPSSPVNATSPGLLGPNQTGYGGYQAPQQTGWQGAGYSQANGYGGGYGGQVQAQPTGRPFQPSSSFGQQLSGQLNAAGYGAQAPAQQQQPQYTGYPTSQPQYGQSYGYGQQQQQQQYQQPIQQQQTATYLAEFDPFTQQQQQQRSQPPQQSGAPSSSQYKSPHPREYVQQHKGELEAWDSYAWKQVCCLGQCSIAEAS